MEETFYPADLMYSPAFHSASAFLNSAPHRRTLNSSERPTPIPLFAILSAASAAWLDLPFNDVIRRISPDGKRPLANNRIQLEQLYLRRQANYQEAHIRIDSSQPVSEVVKQLLTWIGS